MMRLPMWMRVVMLATAIMDILGAITFVPSARWLRELAGFPGVAHPLFLATIGAFIGIFGVAYLWAAVAGKADKLFVAVAAAGKLVFFGLLVRYWMARLLPGTAVVSGAGDLVVGCLFLVWLSNVRGRTTIDPDAGSMASDTPRN